MKKTIVSILALYSISAFAGNVPNPVNAPIGGIAPGHAYCAASNGQQSVDCGPFTGSATLGANNFTGIQTAPAFAGGSLSATAGITFSGGNNAIGTIYTDANWGGLFRGRAGSVADLGLESSAGNIGFQLFTNGTVKTPLGLIAANGISITSNVAWSGASITPPNSSFYESLNYSGTSTYSGALPLNQIGINSDTLIASSAGGVYPLYVFDQPGASSTGDRIGIGSIVKQTATTGNHAISHNANFIGGAFTGQAVASEGGSSTYPGISSGSVYGINTLAILGGTAAGFSNVVGIESDVIMPAGTSAASKIGFSAVLQNPDAVQGSYVDGAFYVGNQNSTSTYWKNILNIGGGQKPPLDPTVGRIIAYDPRQPETGGAFNQPQYAWAFDLGGNVATGGILRYPGIVIDGAGAILQNSGKISGSATTLTLDVPNSTVDAVSSVASGGSGTFLVGDYLSDTNNGIYEVTTIDGSNHVSGVTIIQPGIAISPPANPVAVTANPLSKGTGATLNLHWTAGTTVSVAPSGTAQVAKLKATALPTSCSGQPTNTIAAVASVLTLCP